MGHAHVVNVEAGQGSGGVRDFRRGAVRGDHAAVAHLAAGLGVERGAVEDDQAFLAGVEPPGERPVLQHREDARVLDGEVCVAEEVRLAALLGKLHVDGVALDGAHLARLAGALLLRRELALEARVVDAQAAIAASSSVKSRGRP